MIMLPLCYHTMLSEPCTQLSAGANRPHQPNSFSLDTVARDNHFCKV